MTKEVLLLIKQAVKDEKEKKELDETTYKVYLDIWKEVLFQYKKYSGRNFYLVHPSIHFNKYFCFQKEEKNHEEFSLLIEKLFEDGFKMLTDDGMPFPDHFYISKNEIKKIASQGPTETSINKEHDGTLFVTKRK